MAYDLSTVRQNVRNRLDDEDFEDEYLDRAINYAQWDITNHHHLTFMEASENLSVNTSDLNVTLPTDFHETLYLLITSPVDVRANITDHFMAYENFLNSYIVPSENTASAPFNWSVYAGVLKLSAPADQAYTLKLDYLRSSPKLELETDVPDIPEEFQELLELGAYMRIAKREDDYDVKTQEERDYERLKVSLLRVYGRSKGPGGFRRMRVR